MAAGPDFRYAPDCTCWPQDNVHGPDCACRHYVQGYMDGICASREAHLRLDFLDGACARCGRDESGTLAS